MKVNTDASFVNGKAGIGVVIRNHKGEPEAMFIQCIPHCSSVESTEAIAVYKALEFAKAVDISHLELESDALTMIQKVHRNQEDCSFIGHIIQDIRTLSNTFPALHITFVCRQGNLAAHKASQLALLVDDPCVYFFNFPMSVLQAVIAYST